MGVDIDASIFRLKEEVAGDYYKFDLEYPGELCVRMLQVDTHPISGGAMGQNEEW